MNPVKIDNRLKPTVSPVVTMITETFGFSRTWSLAVVAFAGLIICFAIYWFIHTAPPHTITVTAGPPGSTFEKNAINYSNILARSGVILKILPSQGSLQNLQRLENRHSGVDIGFVQGGITDDTNAMDHLVSLGSIAYEPLLIFYRNPAPIHFLSELDGKRVAIGPVGSGTRALALALFQTNGISAGGKTQLLELDADAAAQNLLQGTIDAVFLMSDSASSQTMRSLMRSPDVQLLSFAQADAYTRRFSYLTKLKIPEGAIDFGKNVPAQDVWLIGPTVELIGRTDLNPALSDLLLETAREVHGKASMFQNRGDFPAPLEHDFKISDDAARYYKSGKTFLYRSIPSFWVASLANRTLVVIVPMTLVLIPVIRLVPRVLKWRTQIRIYRWYRALLVLERDVAGELTPAKRDELMTRLAEIELAVKRLRIPAKFADQFYGLRGHIDYVRERLGTHAAQRP